MSLEADAGPSQIYNELQTLQRQRRQAELKLREIDAKRRPGPARPGVLPPPRDDRQGGAWGDRDRHDRGQDRFDRDRFDRDRRDRRDDDGPPRREGPHPWDVTRPSVPSAVVRPLQSLISKPKRDDDDDDDDDNEADERRRKRKSMEDEEEEEREAEREAEERVRQLRQGDGRGERRTGRGFLRGDERDDGDREHGERKTRRLDSSVSGPGGRGGDAGSSSRTPQGEKTEVKNRNRKMFGNLLGHLQKAKKQVEEIQAAPKMQKRAEIEHVVEEKTKESTIQLREQAKLDMREERRKNIETIREIQSKQALALHQLSLARADSQCKGLSSFIRTKTTPAIFWAPKGEFKGKCEDKRNETKEELEKEREDLIERLRGFREAEVQAEKEKQQEIEERIAEKQREREEIAARMQEEEKEGGDGKEGGKVMDVDPEADEEAAKRALGEGEGGEDDEAVDEEIML